MLFCNSKLFATALATIMTIAFGLCPCAGSRCFGADAPAQKHCSKGCGRSSSSHNQPPADQHCTACRIAATAEKSANPSAEPALHPVLALIPPTTLFAIQANTPLHIIDRRASPPLLSLNDLFHRACLLTI
jgi:hypothetical protein